MSTGTVKWFNGSKGFGFVVPDDGGPDIFVHISAVERSGLESLNEGDQISFELEQDRRTGKASAANIRVLASGAPVARSSPQGYAPRGDQGYAPRGDQGYAPRGDAGGGGSGSGTVKWFNSSKGFGFIQPDDGGQDVFVHVSALERAGLQGLNEGQRLSYELQTDRRTGKSSAGNLRLD